MLADDPRLPTDQSFFRIGEVARITRTPASKLRFWETRFPQLTPVRGGTGQRRYTRCDVTMVFQIKELAAQGFGLTAIKRKLNTGDVVVERQVDVEAIKVLRNRVFLAEQRLRAFGARLK
jgi:DNA-binding transcriptional MerR regulator